MAHTAPNVIGIDITDVAIYGIEAADFAIDGGEHIGIREEVIRVEQSHHIALGHQDALVHCIVDSSVGLRNPAQTSAIAGLEFAHDVESIVARSSVHDNMLPIGIVLPQHTLHRVTQRCTAIEGSGDNRDFHKICNF